MIPGLSRRDLLGAAAAGPLAFSAVRARAAARPIRIGVLTDLTGPYADSGQGALLAAHMAAEDYQQIDPGLAVEIVAGDMQGKPDLGLGIARAWLDREEVDAIADMPQSSLALAVIPLLQQRDKVALVSGAVTSAISGKSCSPNTVHWTYDTTSLATGTGRSLVEQGAKTWFFITADYAFGHALAQDTARIVTENGGTVLGEVAHPFPGTTDFSAYLLQAQASGAQVIGLANAGPDTVNCIKQAHEFGLTTGGRQQLAALLLFVTSINALGLELAQGLDMAEPFYWDRTDAARAWSRRYQPRNPTGAMPLSPAAGCYSCLMHYLKTVTAMGPEQARASGRATVAAMKGMPVDDALFGQNRIRADGRLLNPMFLFRVKAPSESRYAWDYLREISTVPGEQCYRPMLPACNFVH
jgi:branched-chain amino acid transport system substrate-binding protein